MNIQLEILGRQSSVSIRRIEAPKGLELVVHARAANQSEEIASADELSHLPFRPDISHLQVASAINRAIALDFLVKHKLESGDAIRIIIPSGDPDELSTFPVSSSKNISGPTPSAGDLCRPIFLNKPNLEYLYPFQEAGVEWLLEDSGRLLADDMGLGKTIQAVSASRILFWKGKIDRCLVLCPKSLVLNWQSEYRKWAPELRTRVFSPSRTVSPAVWLYASNNVHVAITNYEQIRDAPTELSNQSWDLVIADEAHRLRNEGAQISSGVRRLKRKRFWSLTGTPIERAPQDLANILSIIAPSRFAPSDALVSGSALGVKAKAYILRRRKDAVLPELPKVIEKVEYIELCAEQRETYQKAQAGIASDGHRLDGALAEINEMRKICDFDPATGCSAKLGRIVELINEIRLQNEKAIIFSYFLEPLRMLRSSLESLKIPVLIIDGTMPQSERSAVLSQFKSDPSIIALLASSRVASEGLTLTEANHVLFFNRWWNPSANNQARDRVNRIGQVKTVYCYSFVSINTIEEYLEHILRRKSIIFENFVEKLASGDTYMSDEEKQCVQDIRHHI